MPDDVATTPLLLVAFAVRTYVPAGTLPHVPEYGAVVSVPTSVEPLKNSTLLIVPDVVAAVAASAIVAGAENVSAVGAVSETETAGVPCAPVDPVEPVDPVDPAATATE